MSNYMNYGIDLGTTNSCIARWEGSDVRVFQNNDQMNVTPSVVHVHKSKRLLVGKRAYDAVVTDPDNVATEFKRLMGQKYMWSFPASGRAMSPEELSAEVLKSLCEDARRHITEEVRAAVITVPASFGTLECEATVSAARLAGLEEVFLIQEPIAAAIAYGAKPGTRDQRWMVFDLGGGTLDIAIISTRDGRLTVLEHRGNSHLGGKDIDRMIRDSFLLPALQQEFSLPDSDEDPKAYRRFLRVLTRIAERAKIELSTKKEVVPDLIDLGEDQEGMPYETEIILTRTEIETAMEPLMETCRKLADEALRGARISGGDLDRVLLVGGPTQMPVFRKSLGERLGVKVDHSLDPITVVARGAALFAATAERIKKPRISGSPSASGKVYIRLGFDPVSPSLQCPVLGKIEEGSAINVREVRIEAEGGVWTSGWQPLSDDGSFDIPVSLKENTVTSFNIYLRDSEGRLIDVEPDHFVVRHGLEVSAPPLNHSISLEVMRSDGQTSELDRIFPRGTPLPAEKEVKYRVSRTVKPSDPDASVVIKLWEGEASNPWASRWIGNVHIWSKQLGRPLPEGKEIELTVRLDPSGLIHIEAFIPHLNLHFADDVYLREQPDPFEGVAQISGEIEELNERLSQLERWAKAAGNEELLEEIEHLQMQVEDLDVEISSQPIEADSADADEAARVVKSTRKVREQLSTIELQAGVQSDQNSKSEETEMLVHLAKEAVEQFGSPIEKKELAMLERSLDRALSEEDRRGIRKAVSALKSLRWRVLSKQDEFWVQWFEYLEEPGRRFLNETEAKRWLEFGEGARSDEDMDGVKDAVRHLWKLLPPSVVEADKERALPPGLRSY